MKFVTLFIVTIFVAGCEQDEPTDPVIGLAIEKGEITGAEAEEFIESDQVMAYVLENEPTIYVAKEFESEVATLTAARIEGQTWYMQEDNGEGREKKELKIEDYYPRISIVKWTYLRGFKCVEKEKGTWINVTNKRGKFVRSYLTTEKGWWCMREAGSCKIILKEVTGEFWTRPGGTGRKKTETRKLSACTP